MKNAMALFLVVGLAFAPDGKVHVNSGRFSFDCHYKSISRLLLSVIKHITF